VIDYVGGLEDLQRRVIRSIGDPRVRFVEDPVRMLRAAVFAARLGFDLDPLVIDAIDEHRALIATASPARLIEEYYKILRSGCAEACFRALGRLRLLELITPELKSPSDAVWRSLNRLDTYRQRFPAAPPEFTNALLIGALLEPIGVLQRSLPSQGHPGPRGERVSFGMLPVARRDIERLQQVLFIAPRLTEPELPPRVARGILHRPAFDDALVWLEIFDDVPDAIARWKEARQHRPPQHRGPRHPHRHHPQHLPHPPAHHHGGQHHPHPAGAHEGEGPRRRRRRRRRGRRRRGGGGGGGAPAAS
jgi:poly(A) polymerase